MLPLLIAMGALVFAVIGYALLSPDQVRGSAGDESNEELTGRQCDRTGWARQISDHGTARTFGRSTQLGSPQSGHYQ
jgi:hypothetical protein